MGFPMAVNLRSKIGQDKTIIVSDINESACAEFKAQTSEHGTVKVVKNGYEAVQEAVSPTKDGGRISIMGLCLPYGYHRIL